MELAEIHDETKDRGHRGHGASSSVISPDAWLRNAEILLKEDLIEHPGLMVDVILQRVSILELMGTKIRRAFRNQPLQELMAVEDIANISKALVEGKKVKIEVSYSVHEYSETI